MLGANVAMAQLAGATGAATAGEEATGAEPDMTLWAQGRIEAYRAALGLDFEPPVAALAIPRIGLEAPVLKGTDEASLNRGLGWIERTALPDEAGNIGIAGHRDGFFRGLKDVAVGDEVEIRTPGGVRKWVITSTTVVEPEDVSLLMPTSDDALTLVTCYPFYFVGSAPQRFIVRAEPHSSDRAAMESPRP